MSALALAACGGDSSSASSSAASSTPATGGTSTATGTTTTSTSTGSTGKTTTSTGSTGKTTTTTTTGTTTTTTSTTSGKSTGTTSTTKTSTSPSVVKSIKQWVSCSEHIDESGQLAAAIVAAANNAFVLQIDCPVRIHTGSAMNKSIKVPNGVTFKFTGSGELLTVSNGPPALDIADPQQVTFVDFNLTYL